MTGRVVVVAGASSAAGHAVASALTNRGERVVAVGSNADRLVDVDAAARYACDLSRPEQVHALSARIHDDIGHVDGVIHLVGGWRAGQDDEGWESLERQLITTLRNVTRAFRDDLAAAPAGRLAIVSATAVDSPTWSNANYATAKSAAEAWVSAVGSGWAKGGTAAAVTFVVRSLSEGAGAGPGADGGAGAGATADGGAGAGAIAGDSATPGAGAGAGAGAPSAATDGSTPVTVLADAVAALWDSPASELNRARLYLDGRQNA